MRKSLYTLFFVVIVISVTGNYNRANAQNLGVGGGPSMLVLGGDAGSNGNSIGLGVRGRYNNSNIFGFVAGIYYYPSSKATNDITLNPINPADEDGTFDYESKVSIFRAYAQVHYYFVNNGDEDFGMYTVSGLGLFSESMNYKVVGCDESKYSCAEYNVSQSFSELAFSLGFGFNVPLETFHIYGEGLYNLPYSEISDEGKITINASLELNLGVIYILE